MRLAIDPTRPLAQQLVPHGLHERDHRGHLLYRFHDNNGRLLYVGVTRRPQGRWQAHKNTAEWWGLVAAVDTERHEHERAALDAEVHAIRNELPIFNRRSAAVPQTPVEQPRRRSTGVPRTPVSGMEWKGWEWNGGRCRDAVPPLSAQYRFRSNGYLPARPIGIGLER